MTEIFLTVFFISILLFFLGTGIWVAISMIGVSALGMIFFVCVFHQFILTIYSKSND